MSLVTYWDLSEQVRARLTEEQVARYCDVALAEKGVLNPLKPPAYEPPKQAPLTPAETHWCVELGYRGVAFESAESAIQFLALKPLEIESDYDIGSEYKYGKPILGPPSAVMLFNYNEVLAHKAEMSKYNAARKANEAAIQQYKKDCEAVKEATTEIWSDWHQCRATLERYARIMSVKEEYVQLANGDRDIAAGFLAKAFTSDEIQAAEEWLPNEDASAKPPSGEAESDPR